MTVSSIERSIFSKILAVGLLTLGMLGTARAEGYDIKFLRGGGNGRDIAVKHVCILVNEIRTPSASSIRFMVLFDLPQPNSRIGSFVIDTGRHSNLFTDVEVTMKSPGMKSKKTTPYPHAFLPTVSADYWIDIDGFSPNKVFIVSAKLGNGKKFGDVIRAINEGIIPATATTGLRVGLIIHSMLGRPPGAPTISDDGGFVIKGVSPRCGGR